jgi:membrane protease YdiL (CAAX protease family)
MWSLLAGATGMVAVFSGRMIMQRLVNMPHEQFEDLSRLPVVTVAAMLMMTSVVAGVIEEATFRGYMQVPIERRHGPSVAIGVTSVVFAFAHFPGHSDMALVFVPYITGVGIVFGLLATVTGSIRPSAALHGSGDALVFLLVWWMGPPPVRPLVFDSGIDRQFGIFALLAAGCGAVSVWSFPRLLRAVRAEAVSE